MHLFRTVAQANEADAKERRIPDRRGDLEIALS
jgi:hypothetical protein